MKRWWSVWMLAGATTLGCGQGVQFGFPSDFDAGSTTTTTTDGGSPAASGLPCDVAAVLQKNCLTCHGNPTAGGAPVSLVTYDDLQKKALTDSTKTEAQLSVVRVKSTTSPMPPGGGLSQTDINTLQNWVNAGAPMGSCDNSTPDAGMPATQCTSNTYWTRGDRGSTVMHPGRACIDCHSQGEGPLFPVAGTVFPTAHEGDDCNGASGATVVVTDANGARYTYTTNSAGNFYDDQNNPAFPIHAEVHYNGKIKAMVSPQMSGDCNSCHTQQGASAAPGRITLP